MQNNQQNAPVSIGQVSTSFPNSMNQMNFQSPVNSEDTKDSNPCTEVLQFNKLIALQNSAMSSIPSSTSDNFLHLSTSFGQITVHCQNFTLGENSTDVTQSNLIAKNQNNFDYKNQGDSNLNFGINNDANLLIHTSNQNQSPAWSNSLNPFTSSTCLQNSISLTNQYINSNAISNQVYENNNIQNIGIFDLNQPFFHDSYQWFPKNSKMDFDFISSQQK